MKISEYINYEFVKRYKFVFLENTNLKNLISSSKFGLDNKIILDNVFYYANIRENLYLDLFHNKLERLEMIHHNIDTCNLSANYSSSIPFNELCKFVDIDLIKLEESLINIYKYNQYTINFIGVGGMNYNLITFWFHFIKELGIMHKLFNESKLRFQYYDFDMLEWHNLYRFYNKPELLSILVSQSNIRKTNLPPNLNTYDYVCRINDRLLLKDIDKTNNLYIGGLDMQSRQELNTIDIDQIGFISTVHNGNNAYIVSKQKYNSMAVETYGSISVPFFILNTLKLSEYLINYISELFTTEEHKEIALKLPIDKIKFKFNSKNYILENKNAERQILEDNRYNKIEAIKFNIGNKNYIILDNAN